jgi:hypothetical protein
MDPIDNLLEPGETLVWHGRPNKDRLVRKQYGWCFFAGAFLGLSLLWAWASLQRGTTVSFFVALLFVAVGMMVAIAKTREIMAAHKTRYLVTDRRAVISVSWKTPSIQSYAPKDIGPIEIKNDKDGAADVVFHHSIEHVDFTGLRRSATGFFGINEPQKAKAALEALILPLG